MARATQSKSRLWFDLQVAFAFITGMIGVILLVSAPAASCSSSELEQRRALIRDLPDLRRAADGVRGILDARVDGSTPVLRGELVVYVREEYRRHNWEWIDGLSQELTVRTDDGATVAVLNSDYELDYAIDPWARTRREEAAPSATTGAVRITGITAGDAIMIVGKHASGGVIAESVSGFDRATYLERLDRVLATSADMPMKLLAFALPCLAIAFALAFRLRKATARPAPDTP